MLCSLLLRFAHFELLHTLGTVTKCFPAAPAGVSSIFRVITADPQSLQVHFPAIVTPWLFYGLARSQS
jgi:hypothetical protein